MWYRVVPTKIFQHENLSYESFVTRNFQIYGTNYVVGYVLYSRSRVVLASSGKDEIKLSTIFNQSFNGNFSGAQIFFELLDKFLTLKDLFRKPSLEESKEVLQFLSQFQYSLCRGKEETVFFEMCE